MKKMDWVPGVGILIGLLALTVGRPGVEENGFTLAQYHNADAKFLGDKIITSVDEGIQILDLEGQCVQSYEGLSASWIYVQEGAASEEGASGYTVAYSNHANETHILRLSEGFALLEDETVLVSDVLAIDPILIRTEEGWFLTHTEIRGTINNPDPAGDNGTYTVKLYRSENLKDWTFAGDVISRKQNLEDGDIRWADGVLYYFFEMENYDKGPSAICVMSSEDQGATWSEPKELLPAVADNEMAACDRTGEGWKLYVSSDYACVGESYQGASVYEAEYTEDFEPVSSYVPVDMPDNEAVRLYETKVIDGQRYFLFARNFLTDCDLLLRVVTEE